MATFDNNIDFPSLPNLSSEGQFLPKRICIVSSEFLGPNRNGGIGTAYTTLAESLAKRGHEVTLLYTLGNNCQNESIPYWVEYFHNEKIDFVPLLNSDKFDLDAPPHVASSYTVYLWLKQFNFEIIHFPEYTGVGYFSLLAKHQGLEFKNCLMIVMTHGSLAWTKEANSENINQASELEISFMERKSVALADVLVSPSKYMLHWMRQQLWDLPDTVYAQQNVLPANTRSRLVKASSRTFLPNKIKEFVFFGRLEWRKGLSIFCDALDRLAKSNKSKNLEKVTFLGRSVFLAQVSQESNEYLINRKKNWPWKVEIINHLNQPEAINYLKYPGRLAVIPSLMDNLPTTVLECLGSGIPFIATNVGGIPEMIYSEDAKEVCFLPTGKALFQKLEESLKNGIKLSRFAIDPIKNEITWANWHSNCNDRQQTSQLNSIDKPLVSVCITHFNRPHLLEQAILSIKKQDYPNFEVILVDDGSERKEAIEFLKQIEPEFLASNWQIIRQPNKYLGAARNTASRYANGDFLLFMDDDDLAKPSEISTFVQVALKTNADILTTCSDYFYGEENPEIQIKTKKQNRFVPLGGAPECGLFRNCFGPSNALIKHEVFKQLGGFSEDYGLSFEDWEFFAKATLKGFSLEVIPESLFWYRIKPGSMVHTNNPFLSQKRIYRVYSASLPVCYNNIFQLSLGSQVFLNQIQQKNYLEINLLPIKSFLQAYHIAVTHDHLDLAQEYLELALKSARQSKDPFIMIKALLLIGNEEASLGQLDLARQTLVNLEKLSSKIDPRVIQPEIEKLAKAIGDDGQVSQENRPSLKYLQAKGANNNQAQVFLEEILNSTDIVNTLEKNKDQINPSLLNLIKQNAVTARARGEIELGDGLTNLAEFIEFHSL